jgi:hypothetical protein
MNRKWAMSMYACVLLSVLMIATVTLPVKASVPPPDDHGDIIYAEAYHEAGRIEKKHGLPGWDHAALYAGNFKIVEADPHMEYWSAWENNSYPWYLPTVNQLHDDSYQGDWHHGRVEEDKISDIHANYSSCEYARVWIGDGPASDYYRNRVVDWAESRGDDIWPVIGDDNTGYCRPFDYRSPWIEKTKQYDEWTTGEAVNNPEIRDGLDYGYYCSEIPWGAWKHSAGLNLDPDGFVVWPQDIFDSSITHEYLP